MRDKKRSKRNVLQLGGSRQLLQHLMPRATQGSHSTVSPGASSRGGFMQGIPGGGGGGSAAALVHSSSPGIGGPIGPAAPGIAPASPLLEQPITPIFPGIPAPAPPQEYAQPPAGIFPQAPETYPVTQALLEQLARQRSGGRLQAI